MSEDAVKEAARVLRSGEPAVLLLTGLGAAREGPRARRRASPAKTGAQAAGADLQPPHGARRRAHLDRAHSLSGRAGAEDARRREAHRAGRQPRAGGVLRLSGQAEPAGAEGHAVHHAGDASRRISSTRSNGSPTSSAPRSSRSSLRSTRRPALATGKIDAATLAQSLGALIPENAIVVDEGVSTGRGFFPVDAQRASAHLAAEHGRLDRHRHAARDRRRGRVSGPARC